MYYPSEKDDCKKFEKNYLTIVLTVLYVKNEKIYPAYVSKHNLKHEKQIIRLIIWNGEGWHYIAKKKLPVLLRGVTSKHNGDYSFLSCLHLFRTNLNPIKKCVKIKIFVTVVMPAEDTKVLEFNQYRKSDKAPFIIYADAESLIVKIDGYKINPEKSSSTKVSEHIPSGFSMSTISLFKDIEKKHDVYRGKDCMKKFCESLREHAMKIVNIKN